MQLLQDASFLVWAFITACSSRFSLALRTSICVFLNITCCDLPVFSTPLLLTRRGWLFEFSCLILMSYIVFLASMEHAYYSSIFNSLQQYTTEQEIFVLQMKTQSRKQIDSPFHLSSLTCLRRLHNDSLLGVQSNIQQVVHTQNVSNVLTTVGYELARYISILAGYEVGWKTIPFLILVSST